MRARLPRKTRTYLRHARAVSYLIWDDAIETSSAVMVTAFRGWFDVGNAATGATHWLTDFANVSMIAHFDTEDLFDFTQERPNTSLNDGIREIKWPYVEVYTALAKNNAELGINRDLVIVYGAEPHLRWPTFTTDLMSVVDATDSTLLVTLGAHISGVPHTRPFEVSGSTSDVELSKDLGLGLPSYEGPTSLVGVVHEQCDERGIQAVSLRVGIPHYVTGGPNPKGSRALLERLERITGIPTGWSQMDEAAALWEDKVNEAMEGEDEVAEYVRRLESRADEKTADAIPSSEDLAAEFERFLRIRDTDTP